MNNKILKPYINLKKKSTPPLEFLNLCIPDAKPISLDLKSMHTNLAIYEGLAAFKEALEQRPDKSIPSEFVLKLLELG